MVILERFPLAGRWLSALLLGSALVLAGCAETELLVHTAKTAKSHSADTGSKGRYKVGNAYQIKGVWYYPKEEWDYAETGIASWYGPGFHGKSTANGEVFDENALTAAHRTLPMPSIVRVTNLDNGRSIVVRVNDRGPFAHGRIIDMSRRSAQLLGFMNKGTAKVRVELMESESLQERAAARGEEYVPSPGSDPAVGPGAQRGAVRIGAGRRPERPDRCPRCAGRTGGDRDRGACRHGDGPGRPRAGPCHHQRGDRLAGAPAGQPDQAGTDPDLHSGGLLRGTPTTPIG